MTRPGLRSVQNDMALRSVQNDVAGDGLSQDTLQC